MNFDRDEFYFTVSSTNHVFLGKFTWDKNNNDLKTEIEKIMK